MTIRGQLPIADPWEPVLYVSHINALAELYVCSEHLIAASAPIDSLGFFTVTFEMPEEQRLIRLHVSKKDGPAAMLIIGGPEENHGFFAVEDGRSYDIPHCRSSTGLFCHFHLDDPLNEQLALVDQRMLHWQNVDRSVRDLVERQKIREALVEALVFFSDTCKNWLPSQYALFRADLGFNRHEIQLKLEALAAQVAPHSYLKPYQKREMKSWFWMAALVALSFSFLGIFVWQRVLSRRVLHKIATLSAQELKVASLLKTGKTNKEIAHQLHIEVSTVKSHIYRIFNKLEISSRKEIRRFDDLI